MTLSLFAAGGIIFLDCTTSICVCILEVCEYDSL